MTHQHTSGTIIYLLATIGSVFLEWDDGDVVPLPGAAAAAPLQPTCTSRTGKLAWEADETLTETTREKVMRQELLADREKVERCDTLDRSCVTWPLGVVTL